MRASMSIMYFCFFSRLVAAALRFCCLRRSLLATTGSSSSRLSVLGVGDSSRFTPRRLTGDAVGEDDVVVVVLAVEEAELVDALRLLYFRRASAGDGEREREDEREKESSDEEDASESDEGEAGSEPIGDSTGEGSGDDDNGDSGGREEGDEGVADSIRSAPVSESVEGCGVDEARNELNSSSVSTSSATAVLSLVASACSSSASWSSI